MVIGIVTAQVLVGTLRTAGRTAWRFTSMMGMKYLR
jgi:hypothetical protein